MAEQHSMTAIMNTALTAQGLSEISETQMVDEHRLLSHMWPQIVEVELEDGQYNFTRREAVLASRAAGLYGFDDSYLVPGDAIFVRNLWVTISGERYDEIDWTQDGTRVHLNKKDGCTIEYVAVPDVSLWSANFVRGVTFRLEAGLRRAIWEEYREADALEEKAETHFQRARTASTKGRRASEPYREGRIARRRFNRG